eukprot:56383_1
MVQSDLDSLIETVILETAGLLIINKSTILAIENDKISQSECHWSNACKAIHKQYLLSYDNIRGRLYACIQTIKNRFIKSRDLETAHFIVDQLYQVIHLIYFRYNIYYMIACILGGNNTKILDKLKISSEKIISGLKCLTKPTLQNRIVMAVFYNHPSSLMAVKCLEAINKSIKFADPQQRMPNCFRLYTAKWCKEKDKNHMGFKYHPRHRTDVYREDGGEERERWVTETVTEPCWGVMCDDEDCPGHEVERKRKEKYWVPNYEFDHAIWRNAYYEYNTYLKKKDLYLKRINNTNSNCYYICCHGYPVCEKGNCVCEYDDMRSKCMKGIEKKKFVIFKIFDECDEFYYISPYGKPELYYYMSSWYGKFKTANALKSIGSEAHWKCRKGTSSPPKDHHYSIPYTTSSDYKK